MYRKGRGTTPCPARGPGARYGPGPGPHPCTLSTVQIIRAGVGPQRKEGVVTLRVGGVVPPPPHTEIFPEGYHPPLMKIKRGGLPPHHVPAGAGYHPQPGPGTGCPVWAGSMPPPVHSIDGADHEGRCRVAKKRGGCDPESRGGGTPSPPPGNFSGGVPPPRPLFWEAGVRPSHFFEAVFFLVQVTGRFVYDPVMTCRKQSEISEVFIFP